MHNHSATRLALALLLFAPLLINGAERPRDPTTPYAFRPAALAKTVRFDVTAIFVSETRRVAVINGKRVTEGDEIDGAIVIKILKDSLQLKLHGKQVTTHLLLARLQE